MFQQSPTHLCSENKYSPVHHAITTEMNRVKIKVKLNQNELLRFSKKNTVVVKLFTRINQNKQ